MPVQEPTQNRPLVSVVVPTYNFGHLLPFTLDSLLQQTYTHWECVVVDDGSKDNTEAIMASYMAKDGRFRYHKQPNSGPAKARNTGIGLAKGEYLQFLDADDLLQPDKIQHQIKLIAQHPDADVVYGPVYFFKSETGKPEVVGNLVEETQVRPTVSGSGREVLRAFIITTVCVNAPLVKRGLALQLNMLDESLYQSEDWDFYLRAAQQGARFYYQDNPPGTRALIRTHDSNTTRDFFRLQYYVVKMRQKLAANCTDAELLQLNQHWMLKNLEDLIFQVQEDLDNGNVARAKERGRKAYEIHPTKRYKVYQWASLFGSAAFYRSVTQFSFKKLLAGSL